MSIFEFLFLLAATAVFLLSLIGPSWPERNIRGAVWVAAIALDAALSDAWVSANLPIADGFMATLDLSICLGLYFVAATRWELWIWLTMLASAAVSLLHLTADIVVPDTIDQELYLTVLEACNYVAILTIGGVSGIVVTDRKGGSAFDPWPWRRRFALPLARAGAADRE